MEVTARNANGAAVATTNGVITVEFDAQKLELSGVAVHAGYKSVEIGDGLVKFAYANAEEIPAGQPVATLTFQTRACVSTEVSSFYEQVNDGKPAAKSSTAVSTHEPVVQNASNPTCTEDGYTGDIVCSICGEMLEPGEVIPAHCASKAFQDVDITKWYHPYIDYVVDKGLMQGMGNGMFAPDANMTRAQLVTVLYRMAGSPHVESATSFQDVPVGTWYTGRCRMGSCQRRHQGCHPGLLPTPCTGATREQMFTFFVRFAALNGETIETKGDLTNFTDAASLSPYAVEAVTWAYESGLLVGISSNTRPQGHLQPRARLPQFSPLL
ncbi:MAG: S-layer homology domain-containing protein [Oscillospiraceae bacterium]